MRLYTFGTGPASGHHVIDYYTSSRRCKYPGTAVPGMHRHTQKSRTVNFALNYLDPSVQLDCSLQLCMQHGGDR